LVIMLINGIPSSDIPIRRNSNGTSSNTGNGEGVGMLIYKKLLKFRFIYLHKLDYWSIIIVKKLS
jgi:hypothetical protein